MSVKETSMKRLTFQGVINAEQEKMPEKSRSKSKTRSKASSITKPNMPNRSTVPIAATSNKIQPRANVSAIQGRESPHSKTANESIFRNNKKNIQQQLMKQIIKLKNATVKVENDLKQSLAVRNESQLFDNKENASENIKLEEIQNFLEEFDAQIRKQTKEIGESYMKQLEDLDRELENDDFKVPAYSPLVIPHSIAEMPNLDCKLKQIEERWLRK